MTFYVQSVHVCVFMYVCVMHARENNSSALINMD